MPVNCNLKIGVVLSGGMSKGAYEAGFLLAVSEIPEVQIAAISAASVGALNAYAYVSGRMDSLVWMWKNMGRESKNSFRSLVNRHYLYGIVDSFCRTAKPMSCPLYTVCWIPGHLDVDYVRLDHLSPELLRDYLKASVTVATLMPPYRIGRNYFLDGAVIDNTPLEPLYIYKDLDLVIVVQFDHYIPADLSVAYDVPVLFLNFQDYTGFMNSFDFSEPSIHRMLDFGYRNAGSLLMDVLKTAGNPEILRCFVAENNRAMEKRVISGDYLIRKVNLVMKKMNRAVITSKGMR